MNQFEKFAKQMDADIERERLLRDVKTVGDIERLPPELRDEAWRRAFFQAWVPENEIDPEPRGFNDELYSKGRRTGGHEPWESGE